MECIVCIEKFNKTSRKCVRCPHCQYESCVKCVETFLLENTIIPKCMSCKREWNMEFLRATLSKSFMDKRYKEHQKGAILSEAESRLGQYQEFARLQVQEEELKKKKEEAKRLLEEARRNYQQCADQLYDVRARIYGMERGGSQTLERREFFMACPQHDCRGKLSTAYKCGMCEHFFCPECHKDKGTDRNHPHECVKEDVDTVRMLKDNTRPCPQCHMGIFKTEGCDQMWCVQCHTCFSWKTGRVLNGVVHNPHFFEYQRRLHNGHVPRTLGDVPCGGAPTFQELSRRRRRLSTITDDDNWIIELLRYTNELSDLVMPSMHRKFNSRERHHRLYGVQYLRNMITKNKWIDMLYRSAKQEEKYRRYYQVLETLHVNLCEYLRHYARGENATTVKEACGTLFAYANEECAKMKKQYNMQIPTLSVSTRIQTERY